MTDKEKFASSYGSFYGVYSDFDEASRQSPISRIGYDNDETADRCLENNSRLLLQIRETEYPLFFWLNKVLEETRPCKVLDFGGNLGSHFFKFKEVAAHPDLYWNVYDVEKIITLGRQTYEDERLSFIEDHAGLTEIDVFMASGSIQYVEDFHLSDLSCKPKYLLFARLPLHVKQKKFVTLQNAISSFNPQYVFNRDDFIREMTDQGYILIDEWKSHYDRCIIPGHRDQSLHYYSGLCLRRID